MGLIAVSPDSAYVARSYLVAGGGAAGFVANVVDMRPTDEAFKWAGWRREAIFLSSRKYVALRWADPRHLIVEYGDYDGEGAGRAPSRAVATKGPVSIVYQPLADRTKDEWERMAGEWVRLPPR